MIVFLGIAALAALVGWTQGHRISVLKCNGDYSCLLVKNYRAMAFSKEMAFIAEKQSGIGCLLW
jgi:hypothetical protein